jgi:hypothetical protein
MYLMLLVVGECRSGGEGRMRIFYMFVWGLRNGKEREHSLCVTIRVDIDSDGHGRECSAAAAAAGSNVNGERATQFASVSQKRALCAKCYLSQMSTYN